MTECFLTMKFNELYFVFLRRNKDFKSEENLDEESNGHFEFQRRLILENKMIFSGPLDGAGGLYFFDSNKISKVDLEKELSNDPFVKIKMFLPEIHKFFLPKALFQIREKNIAEINEFFDSLIK